MQQVHPPYSHPVTGTIPPSHGQYPHSYEGSDSPASYRAAARPYAPQPAYDAQDGTYYYRHGAGEYGYAPVAAPGPATGIGSWFEFSNTGYLKGFVIGAGVTLLLTNSTVQKALVRGAVKVWSLFQGGVEEVKEQFRDVKAEMSQET